MRFSFLAVAFSALVSGCSSTVNPIDDGASEVDEAAASLNSTSTYYSVRVDTRRCMAPMCGGFWVKRLNETYTTCADGSSTTGECYVAAIDWAAAGLEGATGDIVRGKLSKKKFATMGKWGVLTPSEVWSAATTSAPSGTYFRAENNSIVCIKAPCFTITADKLNAKTTRTASELGGANASAASLAMQSDQVIVAGEVKDLANGGRALTVSQYWTRVVAKPADPLSCDNDGDCTSTSYGSEVKSASDCYCAGCPTTVMNQTAEAANQASWTQYCSGAKLKCPMYMCIKPRPVGCVNNKCQWVADLN